MPPQRMTDPIDEHLQRVDTIALRGRRRRWPVQTAWEDLSNPR